MPVFSQNTKHGALSLASLTLLASLVVPEAYASGADSIPTPLNTPPPASMEFDVTPDIIKIPNLDSMVFSNLAPSVIKESSKQEQTEDVQRTDNDSGGSAMTAWTVAAGMAVWKFGQQILTQIRTLISKNLLIRAKDAIIAKYKGTTPKDDLSGTAVRLIKLEVQNDRGKFTCLQTPIPFQPDTLKELLPDEKNFTAFSEAFERCSNVNFLPTINLKHGEKPHTFQNLPAINEALWDTIAKYFTDNPREFLKKSCDIKKEEYILIPYCDISEDPTEGKSLTILLARKKDLDTNYGKSDDKYLSVLNIARKAQNSRLKAFPDKPLFPALAV